MNTQLLERILHLRPPLKDIWVPYLQFCTSSEMDLIWSIPNVDEICRRIRAGGSATSMALGREYGISCGSSTATVRRTGWTRQLDGAALCAVSSSLQLSGISCQCLATEIELEAGTYVRQCGQVQRVRATLPSISDCSSVVLAPV